MLLRIHTTGLLASPIVLAVTLLPAWAVAEAGLTGNAMEPSENTARNSQFDQGFQSRTDKYPTSDFSEAKRWLGSAYFFGNALDAAKDRNFEAARFFGEQADKVMTGQATDVKCGFPAVPDVPEPSAPEKIDSSNLERWWEK